MNDKQKQFFLRLDKFIDKYYKISSVRGLFTFCIFFLFSFLIISFLGLSFSFSSGIRFAILFLFVFSNTYVFLSYFVWPLLKAFNVISRIDYEKASRIIQGRCKQLNDLLINIIELSRLENTTLVKASIDQKIQQTSDIEFSSLLSYGLRKYFLLLTLVLAIVFSSFIFIDNLYSIGTLNIVHYTQPNKSTQLISILIDKSSLVVEEGEDLIIKAKLSGVNKYTDMFLCVRENKFIMQNDGDSSFSFLFKKVNNDFTFCIEANQYKSETFSVKVTRKPNISNYKTDIYYPKYLNKSDTIVNNSNILIVPQGTILKYSFFGSHFDTLRIVFLSDSSVVSLPKSDTVVFRKRIIKNENFKVVLQNQYSIKDFIDFKVICIPDQYPELKVSKQGELSSQSNVSFEGQIKDDYGFTKLLLIANLQSRIDTIPVPIFPNLSTQQIYFNYATDVVSDITDNAISFCFELYDNDGVNGPKLVRSEFIEHLVKSISRQAEEKENLYNNIFRELEISKQLSSEIESDIAEFRKKSIDNNLSDWEKNNLLQQITNKTNQLQDFLNNLALSQNQIQNNSIDNERIIEKQNLISDMLNSLIDEELKNILKQISDLANEQAKQINDLSIDLKRDFGNFEKSIDKNLELLKKIKVEEQIQQISDNLKLLSDKQLQLSSNTITDSSSTQLESQKDFFQNISERFSEMSEQNRLLERPMNLNDFDSSFQSIGSNFDRELEQLNNSDKGNLKNTLQQNSQQLKKLAETMENMLNSNISQSNAEDANDLRQILDNLFEVSYNQENIIVNYENTYSNNPAFQDRLLLQSQLLDNFKIVKDSLYSLSKRTVYLGSHISSTAFLIEDDMINSCELLQDQQFSKANKNQRDALKQANDLILLLSESLKNIDQNSSSSGMSIKNKKQKRKNENKSLSDLRNAQESIKNQMKNLLNQMKSENSQNLSKEFAKSLMQNEIYQQMLNQIMMNNDTDGKTAKMLQEVKKLMEKNHTDLANKKLTIQTVMRQQNIVSKLLDAENSENERDKDEIRESRIAKNIRPNTPKNLEEDITFGKNIEFLQKNTLRLNSFFKTKFEEYINSVNTDNYE